MSKFPSCNAPHRRIYVAGPMRGYERFNFDEFFKAAEGLKRAGWLVANPAEFDTCLGFDPSIGLAEQAFDHKSAIMRDLQMIAYECHAIYLLRGWEASRGACLERALAKYLELEIYYQ